MYDVLYNADAAIKLREFDDCIVDLTITSPPYDNLRTKVLERISGNIESLSTQMG